MKITASVTKSSHKDRGPCYLNLPIVLYIHPAFLVENRCFPHHALQDYSSVRIGFSMINNRHALPIVCTLNLLSFDYDYFPQS